MDIINEKLVEGIKYFLIAEKNIRDFVIGVAEKEWDREDFVKYGNDLYKSEWKLQEVKIEDIKPNPDLLATEVFQKDLQERIKKIREILNKGQSISQLILRGQDFLIFDGYARYHVLKERNIKKCLAHVGY